MDLHVQRCRYVGKVQFLFSFLMVRQRMIMRKLKSNRQKKIQFERRIKFNDNIKIHFDNANSDTPQTHGHHVDIKAIFELIFELICVLIF